MLSLAAFNYRDVLALNGGPIERISSAPVDILGRTRYQANAFLRPDLVGTKTQNTVYGSADGTGASESAQVASHMAISEALERWAFYALSTGPDRCKYGFDIDASTNGMAAFPGFFKRQARKRAYFEALERWALVSWWSGRMASRIAGESMGVTAVRLEQNAGFGEVAVVFRRSAAGHVNYGYSAGATFKIAAARAVVELARNEFAIGLFKLRSAAGSEIPNHFERRCLFFAGEEGHALFLRRVFDRKPCPESSWRVLFDGELSGPWSKYATVWRVMPAMPSLDFLDPACQFFFW
jgi:hypothetical protein